MAGRSKVEAGRIDRGGAVVGRRAHSVSVEGQLRVKVRPAGLSLFKW